MLSSNTSHYLLSFSPFREDDIAQLTEELTLGGAAKPAKANGATAAAAAAKPDKQETITTDVLVKKGEVNGAKPAAQPSDAAASTAVSLCFCVSICCKILMHSFFFFLPVLLLLFWCKCMPFNRICRTVNTRQIDHARFLKASWNNNHPFFLLQASKTGEDEHGAVAADGEEHSGLKTAAQKRAEKKEREKQKKKEQKAKEKAKKAAKEAAGEGGQWPRIKVMDCSGNGALC